MRATKHCVLYLSFLRLFFIMMYKVVQTSLSADESQSVTIQMKAIERKLSYRTLNYTVQGNSNF